MPFALSLRKDLFIINEPMSKRKETKPVSPEKLAKAAGVFLFLLGLLLAFSPFSRLWGLAFLAYLPFGLSSFLFLIFVLLFEGALLCLKGRIKWKMPLRIWFGLLCLMIGLSLLFSYAFSSPDISNFSEFFPSFFKAGEERLGYFTHLEIYGGVLGYVLDGLMLPPAGLAAFLPVVIVVLLAAFLLFFFPAIVRLIKDAKARAAITKARREEIREQERKRLEAANEEMTDLGDLPFPEAPTIPLPPEEKTIPVFRYERPAEAFYPEKEEEEVSEMEESKEEPAARTFVRASQAPYEIHQGAQEIQKASPDSLAPGLPREIPGMDPSLYHSNPIQHMGLQPAYLMDEENAEPKAVQEESTLSPSFIEDRVEPAYQPETKQEPIPEPMKEESAVPEAPIFEEPIQKAEPVKEKPLPEPKIVPEPRPATPLSEAEPFEDLVASMEEDSFIPDLGEAGLAPASSFEEKAVEERPAMVKEEEPAQKPVPEVKETQKAVVSTPAPEAKPAPTPKPEPALQPAPKPVELPPYELPTLDLINQPSEEDNEVREQLEKETEETSQVINEFFEEFGIRAEVANATIGPSITVYEIHPDQGVSVTKIRQVVNDLDVRLGGITSRFTDRVLGTRNCSVEVPNKTRRMVSYHEVLSKLGTKYPLMVPFGIDVRGDLIQSSLRKFVHMLVCGMTGSGKSVFMQAVICSIIMRHTPDEVRFLLVDPKRVEFRKYVDIPHLLCPVVTDARKAVVALQKLCEEMDARYDAFYDASVRDIEGYNVYAKAHGLEPMPYIVTVVDEYADLTMVCKEVHESIARLAAKARSCGIHLIIATQRPSVDVISGTIKSNISTRVALRVKKDVDSMTIIDEKGAEGLLGYGDMIVDCGEISPNARLRAQGCYITDEEIDRIAEDAKSKRPQKFYDRFLDLEPTPEPEEAPASQNSAAVREEAFEGRYEQVRAYVMTRDYASISLIQREFNLGYPRSSQFFRRLKEEGIIGDGGASNNAKGSPVLIHEFPEEEGNILNVPDLDS